MAAQGKCLEPNSRQGGYFFIKGKSFSNNFHQHPFPPVAVEFTVENLFPRAEIQLSLRDRDDHFPPHDLAFQVRVGVVFTGAVMMVTVNRFVRCQLFQPNFIIVQQPALIVIDEDGSC